MANDKNIDFIGKGHSTGEVAGRLVGNAKLNVGAMRPYIDEKGQAAITVFSGGDPKNPANYQKILVQDATLRRDEWKQLDEAILPIAESRLNGVQDLIDKGLVYNLGNAFGTTVLEHHAVSDAMEAELSIDGVTRSQGDRPVFNTTYLPIPIIHVDYEINARVLDNSRRLGNGLDTTSAERAARKVAEYLEGMLFTDTDYAFGGGTIYSYVNYPHRNTETITGWNASGKTKAQMLKDVINLKQLSIDAHYYGPWALYLPTDYETLLDEDYDTTTPGTTLRERIMKIGGIDDLKVIDTLEDDNVLLVQMTTDVIRLVRGTAIQNVQWSTEGGMINKYKVMTIQVPQIRSDYNNACGIVHASV